MKCIECKKEILDDSSKCPECGSFQDWRRHFASWGMVLSLVVALISILTLSAEKIDSILTGYNSNVLIAGVNVSDGVVTLVVLNDGGQASAIMWSELEVLDPRAGVNQIEFLPESKNNVIEAHEVRQVLLIPRGNINALHSVWLDKFADKGWRKQKQGEPTECTLTVYTTTKKGMEAISRDATNPSTMSYIPFGRHEEHSKSFYFRIPCYKLFDISMPRAAASIEAIDAD